MGTLTSVGSDQIAAWASNPYMIPAAIVAIAVGYIYYVYQVMIIVTQHKSMAPAWMHSFFMADDITAVFIFYMAATKYDFWFYWLFFVGMFIWVFFEIFCIKYSIDHELPDFIKGVSSKREAWTVCIMVFLVSLCIINLILAWAGDEVMLTTFTICNILAVTIPPLFNLRRAERGKYWLLFFFNNILIAFTNFLPANFGWWTTASSWFDHPWWYVSGVIMTVYTIWAFYIMYKKPYAKDGGVIPKEKRKAARRGEKQQAGSQA
ncbi:MAG: hypothetical protein ACOX69_06410 [Coriobacteriales bacterium]|jgi:hypothetical protein